jgi:stage IV sporulation protein FB
MSFEFIGVRFKISLIFVLFVILTLIYGRYVEVFIFFISITFHELGHVFAANFLGFKTREIELMPFGGMARIDLLDYALPLEEVIIILAGPAVNIAIICMCVLVQAAGVVRGHTGFIIDANMSLAIFNLLPAWPLDGGRLLRVCLNTKFGFFRATELAFWSGRVVAGLLVLIGVMSYERLEYFNIFFIIVAGFIFYSCSNKSDYLLYKTYKASSHKVDKIASGAVFFANQMFVYEDTCLYAVISRILPGKYAYVYVLDSSGEVKGCLTETELLKGLTEKGYYVTFSDLLKQLNK